MSEYFQCLVAVVLVVLARYDAVLLSVTQRLGAGYWFLEVNLPWKQCLGYVLRMRT